MAAQKIETFILTELKAFDLPQAAVTQLAQEYMPLRINSVDDKEMYDKVHKARMFVKGKRVDIEKRREELKSGHIKAGKAIDAEAKRLTELLIPIEQYLQSEETRIDEEKERVKEEKRQNELKRLQDRIARLKAYECIVPGELLSQMTDEEFEKEEELAKTTHEAKLARLAEEEEKRKAEEARLAKEKEKQEEERKRQEKIKKEQDEKAAELAAKEKELAAREAALPPTAPTRILVDPATENGDKQVDVTIRQEPDGTVMVEPVKKVETTHMPILAPSDNGLGRPMGMQPVTLEIQSDVAGAPSGTKISSDLLKIINEIPGDDGWFHDSGRDKFIVIAEVLQAKGLDEVTIGSALDQAYWAVADEYGA